jgi:hypothetical protein
MDTVGFMSPNIVEMILEKSCETSYRDAANTISELTNQNISHQGVWNVIQAIGEKQQKVEKNKKTENENGTLAGKKRFRYFLTESDGIWLSIQGKDRKRAKNKKKELKAGIIYEGWEERYSGSAEYKTIGKNVIAGYMSSKEFKELRDATINEKYAVDSIQYTILNGDGASWIKKGHDTEKDIFQLDQYHLSKSVCRNVSDKKMRKHILRWLKEGKTEKVLNMIEELKYESGGLLAEVKKLETLEKYIKSNINGLLCYKDRSDINIPEPPEGITYRTLGTMERNINIFADRMKRGKSWSIKGATNLSKIIALKMSEGFKEKTGGLISCEISETMLERFNVVLSGAEANRKIRVKEALYPIHKGRLPFQDVSVTNGRKSIKNMFRNKGFSEMVYR